MRIRPASIRIVCCIGLLCAASAPADVVLRDSSVIKGTVFQSGDKTSFITCPKMNYTAASCEVSVKTTHP